jgi:hypothetical protein
MQKEIADIAALIAAEEQPVVIRVRENIERVIAEIFEHPDGIIFADVGYCAPLYSGHPFHLVEGKVTGNGPWKVGKATIRTATEDEVYFNEWRKWLIAKERFNCTRDVAKDGAEADFNMKLK